jgi:hypothetical protein
MDGQPLFQSLWYRGLIADAMTAENNAPPPWLKAHQNGALSEAGARASLLNRFWVLERSVDYQGT